MAFSGNWFAGAVVQDPQGPVRHVADPAHSDTGNDQGVSAATWQAPPTDVIDTDVTGEYPGSEWVTMTPGRELDRTDYESHYADAGNMGAEKERLYSEPVTQFADERYSGARFEGLPESASDINPVVLQRGRNGLAVNNPDGFRLGWVEQSFVNRKFAVTPERVHDHRIVFPDLPYGQVNIPPVPAGQYPTTFGSLAKAITNINQRPQVRREPPPMLADVETDGSPYDAAAVDSWVVG